MKNLYSTAQIREMEQLAMAELAITGSQLMFKAGLAAFALVHERWPDFRQLLVFCGMGNNAGDGYVLAHIAMAAGYPVQVYTLSDPAALAGEAQQAYQEFLRAGGKTTVFSPELTIPAEALLVDALLGIGLNRPLSPALLAAVQLINACANPVLALDVPTGLQADTGYVADAAIKADVTLTFLAHKAGLYTGMAADYVGEVVLAELDLPPALSAHLQPVAQILSKQPLPARPRCAHKGQFGHVLLIGGNHGYAGAIRLAAEAALRSGAGLVSIATRPQHSTLLGLNRPELMCHGVNEAAELTALIQKATVVVIGPGLGQDDWAQQLFNAVLPLSLPCVVDADALNLLAVAPCYADNWLLTPHPGEAARLLAISNQDVGVDRFAAVKAITGKYGGVCVLKGAGSLVAADSQLAVCLRGNPGMATAGMGDVLAGLLGGLLAQRLSLIEAAKLGVYVHAQAADIVASQAGERGMLASDLLPVLQRCLNSDEVG